MVAKVPFFVSILLAF